MKKTLLYLVAFALGAFAGNVEFTYKLWSTGQSESNAPFEFGRVEGATNSLDTDIDKPFAPNIPNGANIEDDMDVDVPSEKIDYMYFRSVEDESRDDHVSTAYTLLCKDYRNPANVSSTWTLVVDSTKQASTTLNWAPVTAAPKGSKLDLCDEAGNVKANMMTATTCGNIAPGVYLIKYLASGASEKDAAPEVLDNNTIKTVAYEGATLNAKLVDSDKYEIVGKVKVICYGEEGNEVGTVEVDPENGSVAAELTDVETAKIKSVKFFYEIKNAGASDNAGTVEVVTRAATVDVAPEILKATSGDAIAENNRIKVEYTDESKTAYNDIIVDYKLTYAVTGTAKVKFTLPPYKKIAGVTTYWTVMVDDKAVNTTKTGTDTITETYEMDVELGEAGSLDINVVFTPYAGAKGGKITYTATYDGEIFPDDDSTSLTVSLSGAGNLNLDCDSENKVNTFDLVLLKNFIAAMTLSKNDFAKATTTYKSTLFKKLNVESQENCIENLSGIFEAGGLDLDCSGNNVPTTFDLVLFKNFIAAMTLSKNDLDKALTTYKSTIFKRITVKNQDECIQKIRDFFPAN